MTVLYGNLQDVTGQPFDQQGTAVVISATQARPAMHSDALTLVELARIPMEDSGGHFETAELDPGPVIVMLEGGVSHGQQWEIGIPDDGERWNLADLIGEQVEWEPIVVSRAEAAARESRQYAEQAEALYGDLDAVSTARDESVAAAAAADVSQKAAATSETNAAGHEERARAEADRATGQASGSADARDAAVVAQGDAAASADRAAERADWSEKCADVSRKYNDTAWTARSEALDARDASVAAKDDAVIAKESAQSSATDAQASAAAAAQSEATALSAATGAASGVRSELSGLVSDASGHASAASSSAAAAAQSAQDAASVVSDGVADASTSMKGKLRLSGDLAGTADNPTVPGLATKSNIGHTHSVDQVTGLQSELDGKVSTTSSAIQVYGTGVSGEQTSYSLGGVSAAANSIAYRTTGGALLVGTPTADDHATTKNYVDTVKTTADAALPASKIQVVTELPESPVAGTIYLVTGA